MCSPRKIPWDGAVRAGNLTEDQLKKIKSVDKVRKEQRKQTIEADPSIYAALLVGNDETPSVLMKASKRTDIIQYVLVLANDLVSGTHATFCLLDPLLTWNRQPSTSD